MKSNSIVLRLLLQVLIASLFVLSVSAQEHEPSQEDEPSFEDTLSWLVENMNNYYVGYEEKKGVKNVSHTVTNVVFGTFNFNKCEMAYTYTVVEEGVFSIDKTEKRVTIPLNTVDPKSVRVDEEGEHYLVVLHTLNFKDQIKNGNFRESWAKIPFNKKGFADDVAVALRRVAKLCRP